MFCNICLYTFMFVQSFKNQIYESIFIMKNNENISHFKLT